MLLYPGNHKSSNFNEYYDDFEDKHSCKIGFVSVVNNSHQLNESIAVQIISLLNDNSQ